MPEEKVRELLKLASEQVPCGIYAVRKGPDYYELKNHKASRTQIKKLRNEYRRAGMKVYCNGI